MLKLRAKSTVQPQQAKQSDGFTTASLGVREPCYSPSVDTPGWDGAWSRDRDQQGCLLGIRQTSYQISWLSYSYTSSPFRSGATRHRLGRFSRFRAGLLRIILTVDTTAACWASIRGCSTRSTYTAGGTPTSLKS